MRITDEMTYRMMAGNLASSRDSVFDIQKKISSGKNISVPSDDPGMYEIIHRLHADLAANYQYERNIDQASKELVSIDNSLRNSLELFQRAGELAVRGSDATASVSDRQAMGNEMNQLLESLINQANFNESGHYRFAGLRSNTKPFTATDSDADGLVDSVTYNGSPEVKQVEISRGVYVPVSVPGANLSGKNAFFQTNTVDLFNTLIEARDRLLAGENLTDGQTATADAATDTLTVSGAFTTGAKVRISGTGTLPGGLSPDTDYYAIKVAGGIQLAASLEDARNGAPVIDITSTGTGIITATMTTGASINSAIDHILNLTSTLGARQETLSIYSDILQSHQTNITNSLDKTESIDVAKAMIELSEQNFAYEAALKASSMLLNQPSLVNFI